MIVGIIPARGGSKGIPRKNLVKICGEPLIYWSIKAARESELLNDFYVSTEDCEIHDYCQSLGVKVLNRPKELALDQSTTIDTLHYHFCNDLPASASICTLQPTSPIRLPGTIDACLKAYKNKFPLILASGYQCKIQAFGENNNLPRQKIKGFFYDDGNVYVHSPEALSDKVWSAKDAYKFFTQEIESYEIDTELDLKIVENLLMHARGNDGISSI